MPFLIDLICDACPYETSDFRGDDKYCPDCGALLRESSLMNHKIDGVRGFRKVDKGN